MQIREKLSLCFLTIDRHDDKTLAFKVLSVVMETNSSRVTGDEHFLLKCIFFHTLPRPWTAL